MRVRTETGGEPADSFFPESLRADKGGEQMKVQELRELIKNADRECLEKAFVESYKQHSKQKKEEVDLIIQDVLVGKETQKGKKREEVNFESLKVQINEFLGNAYAQNYLAPNRVIPKSERPKWRFQVKNFINNLQKIMPNSENFADAAKLLMELYKLICAACEKYYFSTDDPFRSIGWRQCDFFHLVADRVLCTGHFEENISGLLLCAVTGGLSPESLHVEQEMVLLSLIATDDDKNIAIEVAKKLIDDRNSKLKQAKKSSHTAYYIEESVDNLCDMILMLQFSLREEEKGIAYYFSACNERDKEIVLYRALKLASWMEEDEIWLFIYEYAVRRKIKPRESLVVQYRERMSKAERG